VVAAVVPAAGMRPALWRLVGAVLIVASRRQFEQQQQAARDLLISNQAAKASNFWAIKTASSSGSAASTR
jgi:hypothetical protein